MIDNYKGWADGIEKSDLFVVLGTERYFKDVNCFMQVKHARELGKTFLVALEKNVFIPPGYFDGVKDIRILKWKDKEELFNTIKGFIEESIERLEKRRI